MILTYVPGKKAFKLFGVKGAQAQRPLLAGFDMGRNNYVWWTTSYQVAGRLRDYADERAKLIIRREFIEKTPWPSRIPFPKDMKPYPFQIEAARFALERNRSYIAADPGLGKSIISALVGNAAGRPIVFLTAPYLQTDIAQKLSEWAVGAPYFKYMIVPDSRIHRDDVRASIREFNSLGDAILIADEAHRYKRMAARRTLSLLGKRGLYKEFEKVILLSGTPTPNRPFELYPVLSKLAPQTIDFMDRTAFALKYCGGYYDEMGHLVTKGASNLGELTEKVHGTFMTRIRKKDVMQSLPPKLEEVVYLGWIDSQDLPVQVRKLNEALLSKYSPSDLAQPKIAEGKELSTYRRLLGDAKTKPALEYIRDLLDETDEKILVFAFHKDVIANLSEGLKDYRPLIISGGTPVEKRQAKIDAFQTQKSRRVLIGNYLACGTGYDLTKASRVIFVEFSWVPGDNDQASDRAHRIGQKNPVYVQYLVYLNSLDRAVLETNLRKRKVTAVI